MNFTFIKRIFFVGPKPKELRTMLSLTPRAHQALTFLAEQSGETIQKVISDALEQFLAHLVKEGALPLPAAEDSDSSGDAKAI
jgi:hypothetical protein